MSDMLDTSSPIEIPPGHAAAISNVIDRLQGWEAIHWYHDEPIWFVKKREGDLVRRVQISAFRTNQAACWVPALKLIPDVYRLKGVQVVQHIDSAAIQPYIQIVPLYVEDDSHLRSPQDVEKDLEQQLDSACGYAKDLHLPAYEPTARDT